jgi:hypothetical protein
MESQRNWVVLTRPVRDRRMRVEWLEKKWRLPMFGRKACGQVCMWALGGFLSSMWAEWKAIQESG